MLSFFFKMTSFFKISPDIVWLFLMENLPVWCLMHNKIQTWEERIMDQVSVLPCSETWASGEMD